MSVFSMRPRLERYCIDFLSMCACLFGLSLKLLPICGNGGLCKIADLKDLGLHCLLISAYFLGLILGALFFDVFMFSGDTFCLLLLPEGVLGLILEASKNDATKWFAGVPGILGKVGCPTITSGLGVSWVLVLLGPWSLERGRGNHLVTSHASRSKRGGGYAEGVSKAAQTFDFTSRQT